MNCVQPASGRHGPSPPIAGGFTLRSQPLAWLASQLSQPALQLLSWQVCVAQLAVAFTIEQWIPHAPQFCSEVSGSQPLAALASQLSWPALQPVSWQLPVLQLAVPLLRLHATPQPPQSVLVLSAVSQPAVAVQLPQPPLQV